MTRSERRGWIGAMALVVMGFCAAAGVRAQGAKPAVKPAAKPAAAPAAAAAPATPLTDAASLAKGKAIFEGTTNICSSCHRPDLGGMVGPNLTDDNWIHGCSFAEIMKNITTGFPDKGMQPYGSGAKLTPEQLRQVASYVVSKRGSNPKAPKAADPARDKACK